MLENWNKENINCIIHAKDGSKFCFNVNDNPSVTFSYNNEEVKTVICLGYIFEKLKQMSTQNTSLQN